jgi:hypothetical protein
VPARRGEEALRRRSEKMGRTLVRTGRGGRRRRHRAEEIAETVGGLHFRHGTDKNNSIRRKKKICYRILLFFGRSLKHTSQLCQK